MVTYVFYCPNDRSLFRLSFDSLHDPKDGEALIGTIIEAGYGSTKHFLPSARGGWKSPRLLSSSDAALADKSGVFRDRSKTADLIISEYKIARGID